MNDLFNSLFSNDQSEEAGTDLSGLLNSLGGLFGN